MPEDLRKTVFFALAGENPLPGGSGLALPKVTFASAAPPELLRLMRKICSQVLDLNPVERQTLL